MMKPIPRDRQTGAVLVIGLIFLVLLTMIGMTAMQVTTMQERMSGNARDHDLAFQNAEAGLRAGQLHVTGRSFWEFNLSCTNGLCAKGSAPDWSTYAWNGSKDVLASTTLPGMYSPPRFFAEYKGEVKCSDCSNGSKSVYSVVSVGTGANPTSRTFLRESVKP